MVSTPPLPVDSSDGGGDGDGDGDSSDDFQELGINFRTSRAPSQQ